jgi:hypothetical protein
MKNDAKKKQDRAEELSPGNDGSNNAIFQSVWAAGCLFSLFAYGGLVALFKVYWRAFSDTKYTMLSDDGSAIVSFDNNDEFKLLSMVSSAIFATSAVRMLASLSLANPSQRPVLGCVFAIQSCAACTHYLFSKGAGGGTGPGLARTRPGPGPAFSCF